MGGHRVDGEIWGDEILARWFLRRIKFQGSSFKEDLRLKVQAEHPEVEIDVRKGKVRACKMAPVY